MDRHGRSNRDERLDELVRKALEPDPARVRAVVAAALAPPRRRVRRLVWATAAAGLVVVAGVCTVVEMRRPQASSAPSQAIVISNKGGVLTVTTPSGCEWVSVARTEQKGEK